jgi:nucleotide-binding universal stress UspA family protein
MPWKRILVPIGGTAVDPDVVRVAVRLAKETKAEITAVHVIEVRWNLALDAVLEDELDRGEELLEGASRIAQQNGASLKTELLQAREAAAAIVDTARERGSDLIVLGMPYRKRLGKVYVGRTVQDVYVNAPCAVLAYRQEEPTA